MTFGARRRAAAENSAVNLSARPVWRALRSDRRGPVRAWSNDVPSAAVSSTGGCAARLTTTTVRLSGLSVALKRCTGVKTHVDQTLRLPRVGSSNTRCPHMYTGESIRYRLTRTKATGHGAAATTPSARGGEPASSLAPSGSGASTSRRRPASANPLGPRATTNGAARGPFHWRRRRRRESAAGRGPPRSGATTNSMRCLRRDDDLMRCLRRRDDSVRGRRGPFLSGFRHSRSSVSPPRQDHIGPGPPL